MRRLGRRGEGHITQLAIGVLVLAMFSSGLISLAVGMDREYDVEFDETEYSTFQRIDKMQNISLELQENVEEGQGEIAGDSDLIEGQARAAFKGTKILLEVPGLLSDMIIDSFRLIGSVGLPSNFQFGIIGIVFLIVSAGIIALVLKRLP